MAAVTSSGSQAPISRQADSYEAIEEAYSFRSQNTITEKLRERIAVSLGYNPADTVHITKDANIGEGCGNPLAIASLKEGETVVDLGSGGGFDCFLASKQVGTSGKVIGVDMTEGMIALARRNAAKMGVSNTEFVHAKINQIPLPDNSVDCVISNCVLNLVPDSDKLSVINEIHRILKPQGRIAISDYLALKPLPEAMKNDEVLRAGCISGAVEVETMRKNLYDIGFKDVLLLDMEKDLEIFKDESGRKFVTPCCSGESSGPSGRAEIDFNLNEWIASFQIYGRKWDGVAEQGVPIVTSLSKTNGLLGKEPAQEKKAASSCCSSKKCC